MLGIFYNIDLFKTEKLFQNCDKNNFTNILKEFYKRLIILNIPVLTLIPFILITKSKESLEYLKLRILTFLVGLSIIIFSETTIRFISEIILKNIVLLIIPFSLIIILYFLFFYKFQVKYNQKIL